MRRDIEFATTVLAEAVERRQNPKARFEHAVRARREMRAAIRAGHPPREHYRYRWLLAKAMELGDLLTRWGLEFDEQHPDDSATLLDLLDVVNTARTVIVRQLEESGVKVEDEPALQTEPPK